MTYTLFERATAVEFVISQHGGRRAVQAVPLAAGPDLLPGTVMTRSSVTGTWSPISASVGAPLPHGVLRQSASDNPDPRPGVVITGDVEVAGHGLIWPPSMTYARLAECLAALRALGIVVRPDDFLSRATWPVSVPTLLGRVGNVIGGADAYAYEERTQLVLTQLEGALPALTGWDLTVTVTPPGGSPPAFTALLRPAGGDLVAMGQGDQRQTFGTLLVPASASLPPVGSRISAARFGAVEIVRVHDGAAVVHAVAAL